MARAHEVVTGQVWRDSKGEEYRILGPQDSSGQFPVLNMRTNREARKGPRALVACSHEAPQPQYAPPQYPAPGYDENDLLPGTPPDYPTQYPVDDWTPPAPRVHMGGRPSYPQASRTAPASYPQASRTAPAPYPSGPTPRPSLGAFPSELTAFIAGKLAAMRPDYAMNTGIVGQEVARAIAAWKSGRRS